MVSSGLVTWLARILWYKWRGKNMEQEIYSILGLASNSANGELPHCYWMSMVWNPSFSAFSGKHPFKFTVARISFQVFTFYSKIWKTQTLALNKYSGCFGGVEYTEKCNDLWKWYKCHWYKILISRALATEFSQVLCRIQPGFFSSLVFNTTASK